MRVVALIAALATLAAACSGGPSTGPTALAPGPVIDLTGARLLTRGTLNATVDGQPWQGAPIVYFTAGPERFTVFNQSAVGSALSMSVSGPLTVGTYSAGGLSPGDYANFTLVQVPSVWLINPTVADSGGSLTVTIASPTRVAGTFSFTAVPGVNNIGASSRVVTNGTFDVSQ